MCSKYSKSVNLSDQFKDLGVQIIKDASSRTAEEAGDGTTTSMVLAQTLYTEGLRMIAAGHDQTEIRNGMLKGSEIILNELSKLSKQIKSKEELLQVALVSANGEKEIAELIERRWSKNFSNEIKYVIGDEWIAGNLSYHMSSRPIWFQDIKGKADQLDPSGGIVYTGNADILKQVCPGDFGKIKKQGFCMIGSR